MSAPVAVAANTTYVASHYAPVGRYAPVGGVFASAAVASGPLTALRNNVDGGIGVYKYGASGFPTSSYQSSNYFVDVVFDVTAVDLTPPSVINQAPAPNAGGVDVSGPVSVTFSEPVSDSGTISIKLEGPAGGRRDSCL